MPDIDLIELKARVPILEVLAIVGARMKMPNAWDDEVEVWCPFCSDAASKKPAGRANSMKGLYFCFACSFGGDVISVVRTGLNLEFDEAIEYLQKKFPPEGSENPWKT